MLPIGFVLIPDNDLDRVRAYEDDIERALGQVGPGTVIRVEP